METYEEEPAQQRAWDWPAPARRRVREARAPGAFCHLLDLDTDLAEEFDPRARMAVRKVATVPVVDIPLGDCELSSRFGRVEGGPGVLVLDGVITVDACVGERTATELVGAGDLLQPWKQSEDDLIQPHASWRVLVSARLALLDAAFAERVRPWPEIAYALLRRSAKRARDLGVQRAITSHPRLEVRLALMLWHLAGRWGRVEPGGIHLTLPLTHRLLGRLVGAERPSVSHALARLADGGLVTGGGADWHLHGTSQRHLAWLGAHHLERGPPALEPALGYQDRW